LPDRLTLAVATLGMRLGPYHAFLLRPFSAWPATTLGHLGARLPLATPEDYNPDGQHVRCFRCEGGERGRPGGGVQRCVPRQRRQTRPRARRVAGGGLRASAAPTQPSPPTSWTHPPLPRQLLVCRLTHFYKLHGVDNPLWSTGQAVRRGIAP
jgi:hypothetical protein